MAVASGTYRGVSAEVRRADRRTRLIEAGLDVWADPETNTTMTAVCTRAGLSERYFYESFASLNELLAAVLESLAHEIDTVCHHALLDAGADAAGRAQAPVRAFVNLMVTDPRKARVAVIESVGYPALRARRTALLRGLAHQAAVEGRASLGLPARTPREDEMAGLLFVGGMSELLTAWLDGGLEADAEDLVAAAVRSFLGLYG